MSLNVSSYAKRVAHVCSNDFLTKLNFLTTKKTDYAVYEKLLPKWLSKINIQY